MQATDRTVRRLHDGFRFLKVATDCKKDYSSPSFDDSDWQKVSVPHDWAIGHDFLEDNDVSYQNVITDGIKKPIRHTGRTGALPTVGCGWYRLSLFIPQEAKGQKLELIFDGVMWECEVFINGNPVGSHHFGYTSFAVDITPFVQTGAYHLLAVKVTVRPNCSRWYTGAGIFRNVYLVTRAPDSIAYCGIRTHICDVSEESATLTVNVTADGAPDSFEIELCAPDGDILSGRGLFVAGHGVYTAKIDAPCLWSTASPLLYTLRVKTFRGDKQTDCHSVRVGFRDCRFDPDEGFFLNGRPLKLHGVCDHHDLGALGAAVNVSGISRKLSLLLSMGVNAIRTSHNPPAPELLDLCDQMGILVIDELFDEWRIPKVENGYSQFFDKHAESDIVAVIHRDVNHPSVFAWSIGNEVPEQRSGAEGAAIATMLSDICHREDPSRPTTIGIDAPASAEQSGFFDTVDLIGLNYKPHLYKSFHQKYPDKIFYGSETASCISTRGEFKLPAVIDSPMTKHDDLTQSDYGLSAPHWACYPDRELCEQADDPFIFGEFVWTGFDYLGEPTPYYTEWPSRSSYFGIFDTAGNPKSRYFLYKSMWTSDKVLHVLPHWNFEGHEGETVPVHVLTNYDRVELFVNGSSAGIREKQTDGEPLGDERVYQDFRDVNRCRIIFDNVTYAKGELVAVARGQNGEELARACVKTAGKPYAVCLEAENKLMAADGEDVCYIHAKIVDRDGNPCPTANCPIRFRVEGAGDLYATDNGDPRDTVGYFSPDRTTQSGSCVAIVKSRAGAIGNVSVFADAEGLVSATVTVFASDDSELCQICNK